MKNWWTLDADVVLLVNSNRRTRGRNGKRIDKVVIHHNAGINTVESVWRVWLTREASAHYQVESGGRIGQLVWDNDTAWHAANQYVNETSIGIEVSNSSGSPGWNITDKAVEESAHLTAAICRFYKLGRPVSGGNVRYHRNFTNTSCPLHLAPGGRYHARFMDRARFWYDQMTITPAPSPVPAPKENKVDKAQADRIEGMLRLMLEQIAGREVNGVQEFNGWEQGGHRTAYDLLAAIAEAHDIKGTRDTHAGHSHDE
jgi:hypothetical protein